ncbi:MAG: hypothetical protein ABI462_05400 [Ignavibacteria bacterium]
MSDNKINPDPDEFQDGETPLNKPQNKEILQKDSESPYDPTSENEDPETEKDELTRSGTNSETRDNEELEIKDPKEEFSSGIPLESTELKEQVPFVDSVSDESGTEKNSETSYKPEELQPAEIQKTISKSKECNYQISLIDENLLKVVVSTNRGVKINSTVKEDKASTETQSNEINLHPGINYNIQEVEVFIAIDEINESADSKNKNDHADEPVTDTMEESGTEVSKEDEVFKSNYQLNLINENLLKIKILTAKIIRIESTVRDKKILTQTQSNKIILKPKSENTLQEIEITISIEPPGSMDRAAKTEDGKSILIPNPEVVDLIRPPDYSGFGAEGYEYPVDEGAGYQNPFDSLRKLIRKNLTIGIVAAIILHSVAAAFAFYTISKKTKETTTEEPTRLIVLQDLPDPKIKIEDVEDPNKPKIEEIIPPPETKTEPNREITPRKTIRPPSITRPKKETEDVKLDSSVEANLTRELDSLRKLVDETVDTDSTAADTTALAYEIPDSLKNNFSENDIGLAMNFPKNWKLTDQRDINKNETDFKGVVLTDTTAEQPGTMTMFIFLDNENKDYNAEDFKTEFKMNDSTLSAFSKEPKTLAGFTEYRFYIFNKLGTEKLSLRASVRKQFFDQYKNEIEAVVRSIGIRKKEDM